MIYLPFAGNRNHHRNIGSVNLECWELSILLSSNLNKNKNIISMFTFTRNKTKNWNCFEIDPNTSIVINYILTTILISRTKTRNATRPNSLRCIGTIILLPIRYFLFSCAFCFCVKEKFDEILPLESITYGKWANFLSSLQCFELVKPRKLQKHLQNLVLSRLLTFPLHSYWVLGNITSASMFECLWSFVR